MTLSQPRSLKTGGDPRAFTEYAALRQEMQKLSHPARPDVDWQQVCTLCLTLFEKNGVELQSAVWYALARTQIAGATGMAEGLNTLVALITREWTMFWPQSEKARIELLASLSRRLQQFLRSQTLTLADHAPLVQAANFLSEAGDHLQRFELRQQSQLDSLRDRISSALAMLQRSDTPRPVASVEKVADVPTLSPPDTLSSGGMYAPTATPDIPKPLRSRWPMFMAGATSSLLLCALIAAGGYFTQQQANPLLPDATAVAAISAHWSKPLHADPMPAEKMAGWQQGMEQLQRLSQRLDELDEKRGKYLTVSELKTAVYGMQKAFNKTIPLEEQLRQLQAQRAAGKEITQAQIMQTEMHLQQLAGQYLLSTSSLPKSSLSEPHAR